MAKKVLIVMGSANDADTLEPAWKILAELGIEHEVRVASAHRTPAVVHELIGGARGAGFGVVIAAAGMAAHLAGVSAALTTLPVVAVPIPSGTLAGMDALLASTQMPPGDPGRGGGDRGGAQRGPLRGADPERHRRRHRRKARPVPRRHARSCREIGRRAAQQAGQGLTGPLRIGP